RISSINVARNIFINNDHAVLLKEDCFMRAQNNVFVDTNIAVISFGEPYRNPPRDPGGGVDMEGNIFWNNAEIFEHFFQEPLPAYGPTGEVIINRSILPSQWHYLGQDNIDADPIFVDPNSDYHLKSMSPAIGLGACGLDMGTYVPAGAALSGEPDVITYHTDANLTVGGPGITDYNYCINDTNGPWFGEFPKIPQASGKAKLTPPPHAPGRSMPLISDWLSMRSLPETSRPLTIMEPTPI
ncbi:MAG: hypothetical protein ACYTBZ_28760, partial [Planctomycetota bacterium]